MQSEKGSISISTENIFPIIKKWLYSEKDIFIRELVSNANDAIVKMGKLAAIGEADLPEGEQYRVTVTVDKAARTISIEDNGIGMTDDEVRKYINQIAFSGAKDFIEKYKDKAEDAQIIGHFGLGFYSAFMVSEKVTIDTLSYQKGAQAVRWVSDGSSEYEMDASARTTRGTLVTLNVTADAEEFLDRWTMRETLMKYFRFLPCELFLVDAGESKERKEGEEIPPKAINDTQPLWVKAPKDCTDEEYKKFYREVFSDYNEPLFWVHLNVDYPFRLKGILYFPKLKHEFETAEGQVKLYCNQVFVADNIKEVIPEYLLLLKGCIDCPDLPLNVSRSFLQNDGTVRKLSQHITRKVADKLLSIFEGDRALYCQHWDSINPFIKFGCMRDEKFYERMADAIVFKTINDDYRTVKEYLEEFARASDECDCEDCDCGHDHGDGHECQCGHDHGDGHECDCGHDHIRKPAKTVYYVSDPRQQAQYINMFREHELNAVLLNTMIDNHFITFLESKLDGTHFRRIDSELTDVMKAGEGEALQGKDAEIVEKIVAEVNPALKVKLEMLGTGAAPAIVLLSEQSRRMQEMARMFGGMEGMSFPTEETLVLNAGHSLVKRLAAIGRDESRDADAKLLAAQIIDLAMLSHKPLEPDALAKFVERSTQLLEKLA